MIVALGWGGQLIMVIKDLNLVVVTTASDFESSMTLGKVPMVIEEIIPMVKSTE